MHWEDQCCKLCKMIWLYFNSVFSTLYQICFLTGMQCTWCCYGDWWLIMTHWTYRCSLVGGASTTVRWWCICHWCVSSNAFPYFVTFRLSMPGRLKLLKFGTFTDFTHYTLLLCTYVHTHTHPTHPTHTHTHPTHTHTHTHTRFCWSLWQHIHPTLAGGMALHWPGGLPVSPHSWCLDHATSEWICGDCTIRVTVVMVSSAYLVL